MLLGPSGSNTKEIRVGMFPVIPCPKGELLPHNGQMATCVTLRVWGHPMSTGPPWVWGQPMSMGPPYEYGVWFCRLSQWNSVHDSFIFLAWVCIDQVYGRTRKMGEHEEAFKWHGTKPSASLASRVISQFPKCIHNSIEGQLKSWPIFFRTSPLPLYSVFIKNTRKLLFLFVFMCTCCNLTDLSRFRCTLAPYKKRAKNCQLRFNSNGMTVFWSPQIEFLLNDNLSKTNKFVLTISMGQKRIAEKGHILIDHTPGYTESSVRWKTFTTWANVWSAMLL